MESEIRFVDVLLPLPLSGNYTYAVPADLSGKVKTGIRVVVQFGSRKIYTALVIRVHETAPKELTAKNILSVLDDKPIVTELQMRFWIWLSEYYLCYQGEVMNAALPSALKLASESKIALNPDFEGEMPGLTEKEHLLLEALHNRKVIAVSEVAKILEQQKTIPVIKTLIDKGLIISEEEINNPYKPRKEEFIRLSADFSENEEMLRDLFETLEKKAKRQLEILMTFIRLSQFGLADLKEVRKQELIKQSNGSGTQLKLLVEKGVFEVYAKVFNRQDQSLDGIIASEVSLSEIQEVAFNKIQGLLGQKEVVLLHGVTSSGKTEIYIRLMQEVIRQGKQVLFLLPEIALTTQIINRLRKYFGNRVGVYHSRFHTHERVDIYKSVLQSGQQVSEHPSYDVILGARSAVFLPFSNLGLVVVDEEHDTSYKQNDPAPRYNGRDAAIYLAHLHGAKAVIGSATPSLESYYNASQDKYGLVSLTERYANISMPEIEVINTREATRQGLMKSHFSSVLIQQLKSILEQREQAILFQNRRGFSLRLECDICQWTPVCMNCDVTLVYHKKINQLRCHYCGFVSRVPEKCPNCQSLQIKMKGFGTEKVEEELGLILPGTRIARMDLDTTRTKFALQKIIKDFESGRIDILVGTQMVTKGLDFDNVSLVGILNADNMLSYPDFRSEERSYQLMAQVSGRSGRKNKQGKVIIQTRQPGHEIIRQVVENDYHAMYNHQLIERQKFGYPPFTRLILLKVKHKNSDALNKAANVLARDLRKIFGKNILGPEYPIVSRIMNYYIKHILVKINRGQSLTAGKERIMEVIYKFQKEPDYKSVRLIIDVDPL